MIISLSTHHFLKCQNLITSGKQDNDRVDQWQKALNILSNLVCASSPDAQGHSNNQIWGGKSDFRLKIVKQDFERIFFPIIFSKDCSLQAGIPHCQRSSGFSTPVVSFFYRAFSPKSETPIITNS